MPWKHNGRTLKEGREWIDDSGNQHSKVWMRYSDSQKATFKIVWENPPASEAPFDTRFYSGRKTDGTLIPKSLTDVNEVDGDGNPLKDTDGNQIVTPGLKTVWVEKTKQQANSLLENTDWYVTRKSEKSTAIPSSITTYRDAVRTKCGEIETALNGAKDLTAFMALFKDVRNADGSLKTIAKINDWPDET
jgi:hypothetical protein